MSRLSWLPTSTFTLPSPAALRHLAYGVVLGFSLSLATTSVTLWYQARQRERQRRITEGQFEYEPRPIELRSDEIVKGVTGLIGNTPLVRIDSLSDRLGVEILGKAEFLNPGGSVKDRVALQIIEDAEHQGLLHPHTGSRIFEGTVGSTGISLATVARAKGYDTTIIMPDDVAQEKVHALHALGANVERVRPASIVDPRQYVNVAQQYALSFGKASSGEGDAKEPKVITRSSEMVVTTLPDTDTQEQDQEKRDDEDDLEKRPRGFFADQFENKSNYVAHFLGTGPEIYRQTNGRIDAFVSGAGTGGTLGGVGAYLKSKITPKGESEVKGIKIVLADPQGSGLHNKVKHGVMFDPKEAEGTRRRHQVDTVVEGIGLNRITKNISLALPIVDDAFRVTDSEAVSMSRYLVKHDGLFLGSSSACNLVACVKLIKAMGWGYANEYGNGDWEERKVVVTILCDSGSRHYSKFWNDEYLEKAGIRNDLGIVEELLRVDD